MICNKLNESGKILLTHTRLREQNTIRFVPGSTFQSEKHIDKAFELILNTTEEVISSSVKASYKREVISSSAKTSNKRIKLF